MIKSLDRITYLASSLEKAEKTFSSFFDLKPSKRVIFAEKNYESLIYIFENMVSAKELAQTTVTRRISQHKKIRGRRS